MSGLLGSLGLSEHADDLRGCLYRIEALLEEIRDSVAQDPQDITDRTQRRLTAQDTSPANAAFNLFVGTVPAGGQWAVSRVAVRGTASQAARLWIDSVGSGLLVAKLPVDAQGDWASDIGAPPIVTEGRQVWVEFMGQTTGQQVRADVQLDQLQDRPARSAIT